MIIKLNLLKHYLLKPKLYVEMKIEKRNIPVTVQIRNINKL